MARVEQDPSWVAVAAEAFHVVDRSLAFEAAFPDVAWVDAPMTLAVVAAADDESGEGRRPASTPGEVEVDALT